MSIIIPANTLATGGYEVDNSCRFNGDAYVHKAVVAGNQRTFTYSSWIKRSTLNNYDTFIGYAGTAGGGGGTNRGELIFVGDGDDTLRVGFNPGGSSWSNYTVSDKVFRDTSAWYNIVLKVNTTNGTNTERLKIFVNGVSQGLDGYPGQNFDTGFNVDGYVYHVGRSASGTGNFIKGYLAEAVFIDGTALDADSFGEFDEDSGIWKPIDVSGLTFGNNGFHLDFEASGNLGNDANGGTDFTEVSLAATDQTTDTCTNNFATWNGVIRASDLTLSEGNTQAAGGNASYHGTYASIVPTSGKWYAEFKITAPTYGQIGIITADTLTDGNRTVYSLSSNIYWQDNVTSIKYFLADGDGTATSQGTAAVSGGSNSVATYTTNDIISIAIDVDNGKGYFAKNGTFVNSSNPANGTNSFTLASDYARGSTWYFGGNNYTVQANFGNPPYAISSGNADGDGFGNFEYAVPSGYFALCSKNLAEYG